MDKVLKILLFDQESNTVLVNNKFLEANIELSDYAAIPPSITDEKQKMELASKSASKRTLKSLLGSFEIEDSRLSYQSLTEEEAKKYVTIVCYRLKNEEKAYLKNKSSSSFLVGFYHINNLPTGLIGIDGGLAYYITRHFDLIRQHVYLYDPAVLYPSSIIVYKPFGGVPLFTPYYLPPVLDLGRRYGSSLMNPHQIWDMPEKRMSSRSSSSRRSRGSRSSRKTPKSKYKKYKMKYLLLKQLLAEKYGM
jgi:hypothetical protein